MSFITPNDSILRSSNLETSIRTINTAHRASTGQAPLPIAQEKTFAPPFVSKSNEFNAEHVGRFRYVLQAIGVERTAMFTVLTSFLANILVGAILLIEDFCITGFFFGRQFFYSFAFIFPLVAHYNGIQGVRRRKIYQLIVYLVYSTLVILTTIGVNITVIQHTFTGSKCSTHIALAASLLGSMAYLQLITAYFVYEDMCYVRLHINPTKSKKQREVATKLNTLLNSRVVNEQPATEETTAASVTPKTYSVEPNEDVQDTLQQVIKTWEYQRNRRRKSKQTTAVKFDEQSLLLKRGECSLTKSQSKL